jgi:plasmid rolling circle replication initiator protein Rep
MKEPNCLEITTEDPGSEFILLRDITLFKLMHKAGRFAQFAKLDHTDIEKFKEVKFSKDELKAIATDMKVMKNLVERQLLLYKYTLINDKPELYNEFKKEVYANLFKTNKEIFGDEMINRKFKRRMPVISFHDEPDFEIDFSEISTLNNSDIPSKFFIMI